MNSYILYPDDRITKGWCEDCGAKFDHENFGHRVLEHHKPSALEWDAKVLSTEATIAVSTFIVCEQCSPSYGESDVKG